MAKIIKSNGQEIEVKPKDGVSFTLEELQEAVEGYIEIIHLDQYNVMVVNEEGKLYRLPKNEKASRLAHGEIIVGNVLVCTGEEIE